ncbi:type III-A CRISPR-associated protein Csm2 [uncultured Acidaminococcus sp.]|uniref:type III-A CRISPR-associated protein Csm2 n=1 Tax=uncultured Acidaminococcus sp. TaxID=352152 RepID=UPI0026658571|nr:type III-A CRISPR-associated protein Csm2 [uncultured Acidaminococcus sp.]
MTDIVKEAETVIKELQVKRIDRKTGKERYVLEMKTTQIRKFLTAVNKLNNEVGVYKSQHLNAETLPRDISAQIQFLKVKAAYQMGREKTVEKFMNKAGIPAKIDAIGDSIKAYEQFAHYIEALVAYHKYYDNGGKD